MSSSSIDPEPTVILYRYEGSPFAHKVDWLLSIRKIPHLTVLVPRMPPRPELTLLGIDYRRIPVLVINDTVYCDTFKIAERLESIYPDSEQHPSLYPKSSFDSDSKIDHQQKVLQNIMIQFWTDRALFQSSIGLLPWKKVPKDFVTDRENFKGAKIDIQAIERAKPFLFSQFKVQLDLINQLLLSTSKDSKFLFSTDYPTYLDASVYVILNSASQWLESTELKEELLGKPDDLEFQNLRTWLKTMQEFYSDNKVHSPTKVITAQEANQKIPERAVSKDMKPITPDEQLYGLGTQVAVVPDDTGKTPTVGQLIEIDRKSIVLSVDRRDGSHRTCRVCFPRLGFNILPPGERPGKL